mmetsp:Transcript_32760/g.71488  ORF Transcript_32760/g.71488 Transcript_32760/m.71488 type:complete len:198 (-) Transcript_32760:135-728(-)|eukprot:CAMPEP_0118929614 /NCGR_PEP_ID=MMETSP1169-20130426/6561_1 /TAXON_ID=36882 /ORGANISM="Pyramimonas obovata, Strain CCMP722" /LENGTH=197 /DNA_ID=CAMNT_0006871837 /DNA_START=154 /DNA_END=747 /DNA_ORIENTATION=-
MLTAEHHCFTQALLARGFMEEVEARTMFKKIADQNHDRNFDSFWSAINSAIRIADLKLQRVRYPHDGDVYIGIVNTLADEPAKLATNFTPEQIAYFRAVLELIATDEVAAQNGIDSRKALNATPAAGSTQSEGTQQKKLNPGEKEAALRQLGTEGWLQYDTVAGVIKLGVRTFLELGPYLLNLELSERTKELWADLV